MNHAKPQTKNGVTMTLKTITPELAESYLQRMKKNRKIQESQVDFYLKQMLSGQWQLTGDSVKFSVDGDLFDGQHRLKAVIKYGKPVEMFVAEGLEPDTFEVLDTGKARTAGDVLSIMGIEKHINIAAIARQVLLMKNGYASYWTKRNAPTNTDILNYVMTTENLNEVLTYIHQVYRDFRYIPVSVLGGLYLMMSEKNQVKADAFFDQYRTGLDLKRSSPVYLLRDRLMKNEISKTKLTRRDKLAIFINAWNAYVLDKPVTQLKIPGKAEKFPEII